MCEESGQVICPGKAFYSVIPGSELELSIDFFSFSKLLFLFIDNIIQYISDLSSKSFDACDYKGTRISTDASLIPFMSKSQDTREIDLVSPLLLCALICQIQSIGPFPEIRLTLLFCL